ncbi:hypothetical protein PRIPAC_88848 [Pristionchus pacificus]|uniref:Peptidase n=1 Tax=Pristionchus pacificus TaxID=54126 RepID=A0A2A6CWX5_PRIPA|nr:hypothetical protein PRIPAC_88848 [Pristionchus pacificus]|eukprot:PDM82533.1 Peptidase [Pristionchus pacificus]
MRSSLLLCCMLYGVCNSVDPDESLPVYLRGMNWHKVIANSNVDLRLSDKIAPSNYAIDLAINVRGHAGAPKSDFNGTVTINLDIIKPVNIIELHSNGLIIEKARLVESVIFSNTIGITRISHNLERETITIHVNRTIQPKEEFMLQISYNGVAKLDEYGLDPKFNESLDSNGPYILATNNFPTGARFCGLNVYSNTDVKRKDSLNFRTITVFEKTRSLSTHQVALSINHLSAEVLEVQGFSNVRLISSTNSHNYYFSIPNHLPGRWAVYTKISEPIDIAALLKRKLGQLDAYSINDTAKEKLDIVILEGTTINTIQPGLITIGRPNLWIGDKPNEDLVFLNQLGVRNFISVHSANEMWQNYLFSNIFVNYSQSEKFVYDLPISAYSVFHASLHEKPLRDLNERPASTTELLHKCYVYSSEFQYLNERINKFHDIDYFVELVSSSCENSEDVKNFLDDYINQPGKALLIVNRKGDSVTVKQTRYHSTYFSDELRDLKTRYTIPIRYSVDSKKNQTATFLIDHNCDQLYFIFYEDIIIGSRNITQEERDRVMPALSKSMIAALTIGYKKYSDLQDQLKVYAQRHYGIYSVARQFISVRYVNTYVEDSKNLYFPSDCEEFSRFRADWNGMFNNNTKYWEQPTNSYDIDLVRNIDCINEWFNSTNYWSFLENNFLGNNSEIRPNLISRLITRTYAHYQWRELHRFFFRKAGNFTNHRFDLLADTIFNEWAMERLYNADVFPNTALRDDYLNELNEFVRRDPRRASSMSSDIEKRFELECIRKKLPDYHNEDEETMFEKYDELYNMFFRKLGKEE